MTTLVLSQIFYKKKINFKTLELWQLFQNLLGTSSILVLSAAMPFGSNLDKYASLSPKMEEAE
jgi:hypothetical protein